MFATEPDRAKAAFAIPLMTETFSYAERPLNGFLSGERHQEAAIIDSQLSPYVSTQGPVFSMNRHP